ncbi:MAG: sugar porter family MFS transporter [Fusobacteria bacterium]|nr:sugar porter family MFS transporter [Fusobacteriota bacterium]
MTSNYVVKSYKGVVIVICTIAALGGLLFGLDQGFIANSLPSIEGVYHLGFKGGESYAGVLAWGGILGALLSGVFARFFGRKKSLLIAGFLFSALTIISALLPPVGVLTGCRFGLGFAVGVASLIVPLYLSETAPASIRGSMGTLYQFMITIGIFLISLTNVFIARLISAPHIALPLMFLVIAVFALIMFFGCFLIPESPRWLMLKNRREDAVTVLGRTLNSTEEIEAELNEIALVIGTNKGKFMNKYFIKILIVGVVLQMFQQLVGINAMIYYAPTIFGYGSITGFVGMMTIPIVNMLFTIPAFKWVEKMGRKKLLYLGSTVMLITMLGAGFAFVQISHVAHPGMGLKALLLISLILYIFGFACSWGPVAWLICSEIFPIAGRETGMTVTTMVNWLFAGIVMSSSLSFMHTFGNASIFFLFAGFCILSFIFVKFFVPETKGITLEKIETDLKKGIPLRKIGQ